MPPAKQVLIGIASIILVLTLISWKSGDPIRAVGSFQAPMHANRLNCNISNFEELKKAAIVYTWVNGTERCYNQQRHKADLSQGGSSRDKEIGELKYSLRSLIKYAPWLEASLISCPVLQLIVCLGTNLYCHSGSDSGLARHVKHSNSSDSSR